MSKLVLTPDQENAIKEFHLFLFDPEEQVFILEGYSGTGKSTVVKEMVNSIPKTHSWLEMVNPEVIGYQLSLTATTNKAVENFSHITGKVVKTIHSFLGLIVNTDYKTGITKLIPKNDVVHEEYILFIDEASFIDSQLLGLIFSKTRKCKIVFVGDPNQLIQVKAANAPVFLMNCRKASLTQVVRQAEGNPIVDLSAKFCQTVSTGEFFKFKPDGHHIVHLPREEFEAKILAEFCRDSWRYSDSKILAWTNKRAIAYNNFVINSSTGAPKFYAGDYVICNSYFSINGRSIKTDEMVHITDITENVTDKGVLGAHYRLNGYDWAFMPYSLEDRKERLKRAKNEEDFVTVERINKNWIDLRAAYASTVAKSQGSTYDSVYVDLSDIAKCNSGNAIARMLYVAVSRARHHVYLTGDLC
jgi:deoxyadenosine/deoxycytidine kinase